MTHFPMSRIRIYNFILCSKTNTTFRNVFSELRIKYSIKSCYSKIQARYNSVSGWSNIHRHVISWKSIQRCFSMILIFLIILHYIRVIASVWFEEWLNVWKEVLWRFILKSRYSWLICELWKKNDLENWVIIWFLSLVTSY